ncbi:MAG: HD domain-containing protein, partial [Terriglobia bacterium]
MVWVTMTQFERVLKKVESYRPGDDLAVLHNAYRLCLEKHEGQRRLSGEPYISHPLEVMNILADLRLDTVCLAAGMLHDVIEDTETSIEGLDEQFGPEIAHIVEGVTKISRIHFLSPEQQQAENFRKMLLAMVDDVRVVLVKLADRLHNMRTLEHLPPEKR